MILKSKTPFGFIINSSILSIVIGFIWTSLVYFLTGGQDTAITILVGSIFAIVLEILLVIIEFPLVKELLQSIQSQSEQNESLIKQTIVDNQLFIKIRSHLHERQPYAKNIGLTIFNDYLKSFALNQSGFYLGGEELSLSAYVKAWDYLVKEQKKIGNNPEKCLIARITHSNDISIWLAGKHDDPGELLSLQKKFIQFGGKISRALIGPTLIPDETYSKVIKSMTDIGIKVCYFSHDEVGEKDYDFLYLYDQNFVIKWYSGQNGRKLAGFFLSDDPDSEITNRWAYLFDKAADKGNDFDIPPDRQY